MTIPQLTTWTAADAAAIRRCRISAAQMRALCRLAGATFAEQRPELHRDPVKMRGVYWLITVRAVMRNIVLGLVLKLGGVDDDWKV